MPRAKRTGRKHQLREFAMDLYQILGGHFLVPEDVDEDTQIRILDNLTCIVEDAPLRHQSPIREAKTPFR